MEINFIKPSPTWELTHGKVYCIVCKENGKKTPALVCTLYRSVSFRREHAACEQHINILKDKILRDIERESYENERNLERTYPFKY